MLEFFALFESERNTIIQIRVPLMQSRKPLPLNFSILLIFLCVLPVSASQEWELKKAVNNIKVFSRLQLNQTTQRQYKQILASTVVKSEVSSFIALLNDTSRAPEWIDNCISVTVKTGHSSNTKIVQSTFHAPWPLHNRDMITKSTTVTDKDITTITIEDVGADYPLQNNTVRMQDVEGTWIITNLENNMIEISYLGSGSPSGNIPLWLADQVLINSTFKTFVNLTERLNSEITD